MKTPCTVLGAFGHIVSADDVESVQEALHFAEYTFDDDDEPEPEDDEEDDLEPRSYLRSTR